MHYYLGIKVLFILKPFCFATWTLQNSSFFRHVFSHLASRTSHLVPRTTHLSRNKPTFTPFFLVSLTTRRGQNGQGQNGQNRNRIRQIPQSIIIIYILLYTLNYFSTSKSILTILTLTSFPVIFLLNR